MVSPTMDVAGGMGTAGALRRPSGLTQQETAVLVLLGEGRTARAIGRCLGISPRTVQKHLERTYRKLGVRDRLAAVLAARDSGLLSSGRASSS